MQTQTLGAHGPKGRPWTPANYAQVKMNSYLPLIKLIWQDLPPKKPTAGYACKKQCCPCILSGRQREQFDQNTFSGRLMTEDEGNWENECAKSFVGNRKMYYEGIQDKKKSYVATPF